MDFTSEAGYKLVHSMDTLTGIVTITINDLSDNLIGEIVLENYKVRALLDSLGEVMKGFYPTKQGSSNWRFRTSININEETAKTEWSVP